MSDDNIDTPTNNQDQTLSTKDKLLNFVEKHPKELLIAGAALVIIIAFIILYFSFIKQTSMTDFAEDFCNCAEQTSSDYYNYSKDGFGYKSDLTGCFAEQFSYYSDYYNKEEKKRLLIEFQQEVIKKCPQKLNNVFEYK